MIDYKDTIRLKASAAITSIANNQRVEGQPILFAGTELITELLVSGVNPNLLDQAAKTVHEKLENNEYEFF